MPPRKKQKTVRNAHLESDGPLPEVENPTTEQASSVTAPSWKGTKHCHASMEKFIDGPVDIVVEVLSLLHPRDLLTLVRTSSVFRNFLLAKCRRQLWKTVIANATGLPPQPPFLSEPAFVHLLYSKHCHNCGTVVRQAITGWFKRVCPKCIPEVSVTWNEAWRQILAQGQRKGSELFRIFHLVLNGKQPSYMSYSYYGSEEAYMCSNADLDMYLRQLRNIKKNPDQTKREKAYQAIVKEWMQRLKRREKYSVSLKEWFKKEEQNRLATLGDKKAQRFTEIVNRLRDSAWVTEIEFLSDGELQEMSKLPVVRRSAKLTNREYSRVLTALEGFLNKTRRRRLLGDHQVAVRARLGDLEKAMLEHYVQLPRTAAMDIRPNYIEFALMDKCKDLADVPVGQTVTMEEFLAMMPDLHKKWQSSAKTQLVRTFKKYLKSPNVAIPATRDPLNLAVAVFVCQNCHPFACMRYPAVLAHTCGYTSEYDRYDSSGYEDPDDPTTWKSVYSFTARRLHVDKDNFNEEEERERFALSKVVGDVDDCYVHEVLEPMCAIVRALGLNPATATAADLETCDARLRCATCAAEGNPDAVYGWDAALLHFREFYRRHAKWKWKRVHGAEMDKVRELEAVRDARPLDIDYSVWACSLCVDWDSDTSDDDIDTHLLNEHGLEDADECARNGTIYVHPAKNTALMRPPVVLAKV